jgi:hypothetical protein
LQSVVTSSSEQTIFSNGVSSVVRVWEISCEVGSPASGSSIHGSWMR